MRWKNGCDGTPIRLPTSSALKSYHLCFLAMHKLEKTSRCDPPLRPFFKYFLTTLAEPASKCRQA